MSPDEREEPPLPEEGTDEGPEAEGDDQEAALTEAGEPVEAEEIQQALDEGEPREVIRAMLAGFKQQTVPSQHPLTKKVTSDHISQALDIQDKAQDYHLKDRGQQRWHVRFIFGLTCVFLLLLVGLLVFTGNASQVEAIVTLLIIAAASAFGGWGYGRGR